VRNVSGLAYERFISQACPVRITLKTSVTRCFGGGVTLQYPESAVTELVRYVL